MQDMIHRQMTFLGHVIRKDELEEVMLTVAKRHSLHAVELPQRSGKPSANCVDPSHPQ